MAHFNAPAFYADLEGRENLFIKQPAWINIFGSTQWFWYQKIMLIPKDVLFIAINILSNFSVFGFMPQKKRARYINWISDWTMITLFQIDFKLIFSKQFLLSAGLRTTNGDPEFFEKWKIYTNLAVLKNGDLMKFEKQTKKSCSFRWAQRMGSESLYSNEWQVAVPWNLRRFVERRTVWHFCTSVGGGLCWVELGWVGLFWKGTGRRGLI